MTNDNPAQRLAASISDGSVTVAVIGLGYVGLPLVGAFVNAGVQVIGFDIDPAKVAALAAGRCYLRHLGEGFGESLRTSGRFEPTGDFSRLVDADAVLLCVPTPLGAHREPDLSFVEDTVDIVGAHLRPGQLVVLESTTYPGTTRDIVAGRLAALGRCTLGEDFFVAFAPERQDPGRRTHDLRSTPRVVGGVDSGSGELAAALYRLIVDEVHQVRSAEVAEAAKLLENVFRSVNIALVNETKMLLTELGIDIWEVIEAAATKPFGFTPFYPGPGLGGHCIPVDPYYLAWRAREFGLSTRFIELAGEVNRGMPGWVVGQTVGALNEIGLAPSRSRILVLGLAYKPDVDDTRESPAFAIIDGLRDLGAAVDYHDPWIAETVPTRGYDLGMRSIALTEAAVASYSAVVICTDHSSYDWRWLAAHAELIVDTRNAMAGVDGRARVVRA